MCIRDRGNISRIENALTALDKKLGALNTRLSDLQRQVENAREELEKPFPQEDELREKSARLVELNACLLYTSTDGHTSTRSTPPNATPTTPPTSSSRTTARG